MGDKLKVRISRCLMKGVTQNQALWRMYVRLQLKTVVLSLHHAV